MGAGDADLLDVEFCPTGGQNALLEGGGCQGNGGNLTGRICTTTDQNQKDAQTNLKERMSCRKTQTGMLNPVCVL